MNLATFPRIFAIALSLALAGASLAQPSPSSQSKPYEPSIGQQGKDVVWVPTPLALVEKMLDMAKVTRDDYVIDLGSGDGRTVMAAAKRGARALGIEYNPEMVELSRRNAKAEGVAGRTEFVKQDLFEADLSKATVITMFLLTEINLNLRPTLLGLKPGTRIVSNTFDMGEWDADETVTLDRSTGCNSNWCKALLWIVPAQVAGTHQTAKGELALEQSFQMLSGTLRTREKTVRVDGRVRGNQVTLLADGQPLHGSVDGGRLILN